MERWSTGWSKSKYQQKILVGSLKKLRAVNFMILKGKIYVKIIVAETGINGNNFNKLCQDDLSLEEYYESINCSNYTSQFLFGVARFRIIIFVYFQLYEK